MENLIFVWKGPYVIYGYRGNNAFFLKEMDGTDLQGGPEKGRMLKHYYSLELTNSYFVFTLIIVHIHYIFYFGLDISLTNLKPREKALSFERKIS